MKWFSHDSNLRNQAEFKAMAEVFGSPTIGYGIGVLIWEIVAENGSDDFRMPLKGKFDMSFWRREFGLSSTGNPRGTVMKILLNAASAGIIDGDALNEGVVWVPALRERLDEYAKAKRKAAEKEAAKKQSQ